MRSSFLDYLQCPTGCEAGLALREGDRRGPEVWSGSIACGVCGREWPIEEGIPRLLPDSLLSKEGQPPEVKGRAPESPMAAPDGSEARKRAEMRARDEQAADYDRMWHLNLFGLIEVPATLLNMNLASHHLLLEAGCGTGRMTRQFARRCREQISIDFSWESLKACRAKLTAAGITNVHLAQADLCQLPFRSELFDRVVSCQVLEHIPSQAARASAVREMARVLRSGGNLTLSAYQYSLLMRLFGEKEGEHDGGIYFYRFTREELRALLETSLGVEAMTGALVYHFIARCRK